ncbi:MAG: DUF3043 domain-containing protein [bacterium]
MRLLPRRPAPADPSAADAAEQDELGAGPVTKGRPTPKRRDSEVRRGPAAPAPKTRREAIARQREQVKKAKTSGTRLSPGDRRARMLAGDEAFLPRRDAGPLRALARDYVDSRRMLSNVLLVLFPLIVLSGFARVPAINIVVLVVFMAVLVEWILTGRKLLALATTRGIDRGKNTALGLGFYAGSRAYLPRKWRVPRARVGLREPI